MGRAMTGSSLRKLLLMSAGVLAVGLGIVGLFLPLLPTTPFLLLAAACFVRSSDTLYEWLTNHRWFGRYIKNYREHRATTRMTKIVTLVLLWGTIGYTALVVVDGWQLRSLLFAVALGVTIHVLSLGTIAGGRPAEERKPGA